MKDRNATTVLVLNLEEELDVVVDGLRDLCRTAAVDLALAIGKLIVDEVFGGSIERWKAHGTKHVHYRRLARRPDLPLSASALCRSVAIYVLRQELGGRRAWNHLSTGHFQEVLVLKFPEQRRLIEAAEEQHWTVKRLRAEVALVKPNGRGRQRQRLASSARDLKSYLERHHEALDAALLDAATAAELRRTIDLLSEHCESLERVLNLYGQVAASSIRA